jgi:hypothetical protein
MAEHRARATRDARRQHRDAHGRQPTRTACRAAPVAPPTPAARPVCVAAARANQ